MDCFLYDRDLRLKRVKELAGNEDFPGIEIKNLELK